MTIPHEMAILAEMLKHHGIYYEIVKCYDGVQLFIPAGGAEGNFQPYSILEAMAINMDFWKFGITKKKTRLDG